MLFPIASMMMKMKMFTLLIIRLYLSSKMRTFLPAAILRAFDNTIIALHVTFWLLVSPRYGAAERNIAATARDTIFRIHSTTRHDTRSATSLHGRAKKTTKRTTQRQRKSLHSAENPLVFQLLIACPSSNDCASPASFTKTANNTNTRANCVLFTRARWPARINAISLTQPPQTIGTRTPAFANCSYLFA